MTGYHQFLLRAALLPFLLLALLLKSGYSQTGTKPPDRMKMLNAFNGTWHGEMEVVTEKKKSKYKLSHTSQKVAGGWGVMLSEVAIIPAAGKYQAARVFSYSAVGDTTYMYTVDSNGETWFYKGVWSTTKKLILKSTGGTVETPVEKTISYSFLSPKEYQFQSITKATGKEDEIVEMNMRKE